MSSWKLTAPDPTTVFRASSGQERRHFRGFVRVAVDTRAPRSIKLRKLFLRYVSKVHLVHLYICVCFMENVRKWQDVENKLGPSVLEGWMRRSEGKTFFSSSSLPRMCKHEAFMCPFSALLSAVAR